MRMNFRPTICRPFRSKRVMISPHRLRCTASGLRMMRVRSRFAMMGFLPVGGVWYRGGGYSRGGRKMHHGQVECCPMNFILSVAKDLSSLARHVRHCRTAHRGTALTPTCGRSTTRANMVRDERSFEVPQDDEAVL